jgi:hypothetical protein
VNWPLFLIGTALITLVMIDALKATLAMSGGGLFSNHLLRFTLTITRVWPKRFRANTGVIALVIILLVWALGLWIGYSLVLASSKLSVVDATTKAEAGVWEQIYVAGYSLITLGVGDYAPNTPFFQVITVISAMNGFLIFTLAVTYFGSVVNAVVQSRNLAGRVQSLGATGPGILATAWNGRDFGRLENHLIDLTAEVGLLTKNYLAYPVVHYYETADPKMSVALAVAALEDAALILEHGVDQAVRLEPSVMKPLVHSLERLTEILAKLFVSPSPDHPPLPDLSSLEDLGVPLLARSSLEGGAASAADRRRALLALVEDEGWQWKDQAEA